VGHIAGGCVDVAGHALAVAGAAHNNIKILVAGLVLSVALMAVAADWVARLIVKHRWLGYVRACRRGLCRYRHGLVRGTREVFHAL